MCDLEKSIVKYLCIMSSIKYRIIKKLKMRKKIDFNLILVSISSKIVSNELLCIKLEKN